MVNGDVQPTISVNCPHFFEVILPVLFVAFASLQDTQTIDPQELHAQLRSDFQGLAESRR
jgi:hypothetical protein